MLGVSAMGLGMLMPKEMRWIIALCRHHLFLCLFDIPQSLANFQGFFHSLLYYTDEHVYSLYIIDNCVCTACTDNILRGRIEKINFTN